MVQKTVKFNSMAVLTTDNYLLGKYEFWTMYKISEYVDGRIRYYVNKCEQKNILGDQVVKLKDICDTRWLSTHKSREYQFCLCSHFFISASPDQKLCRKQFLGHWDSTRDNQESRCYRIQLISYLCSDPDNFRSKLPEGNSQITSTDFTLYLLGGYHLVAAIKGLQEEGIKGIGKVYQYMLTDNYLDLKLVLRHQKYLILQQFATHILNNYSDEYPDYALLYELLLVSPVTSLACERAFSCQNRIKTKLRSRPTTDSIQTANDLLRKIQSIGNASQYILAKVYGVNVTDIDITSLFGNCWLTDQVIDAYMAVLCQAQQENGRNILHIPAAIMTNICKGDSIRNQTEYMPNDKSHFNDHSIKINADKLL
ncbi:unnamed protein product [Mytilus coruscus]|uniref:HAT C-terminal dimerisation domain-containing protein n=1 Tax=Mytilus coruscus TaxID=42192 RepID=A0A6J8E679_MYTCO|nr:unnamed protein product [Mytilus coruscus]